MLEQDLARKMSGLRWLDGTWQGSIIITISMYQYALASSLKHSFVSNFILPDARGIVHEPASLRPVKSSPNSNRVSQPAPKAQRPLSLHDVADASGLLQRICVNVIPTLANPTPRRPPALWSINPRPEGAASGPSG